MELGQNDMHLPDHWNLVGESIIYNKSSSRETNAHLQSNRKVDWNSKSNLRLMLDSTKGT